MNDVRWIKIVTDIFDNRKIKLIEKMPKGDSIIVIWFKILCLAGQVNDGGLIYLTKEIPYTDEMLATAFGTPLPLIRKAMQTFFQFKMIEKSNDFYFVSSWEEYQNVDGMERIREQTRQRVARHREKLKVTDSNATVTLQVTHRNAPEKEEELEVEKEVKKRDSKESRKETSELDKALEAFAQMRRAIRAPMTERAKELIIAKLEKLAPTEEGKIAILNQSIENGWKGVYPLKDDTQTGGRYMTKGEQARKDLQDSYDMIANWAERKEQEGDTKGIWDLG